ncbi:DUF5086 family protein, partial [Pseudomonas aeruginosa]|uniref:DUF5086 family protein n=1 Tax=Pseudomonas aeruginosa TaxID=287 RepID=UPI003CC55730
PPPRRTEKRATTRPPTSGTGSGGVVYVYNRQGLQPWQFQRLAAHLALTEQGLRASIVGGPQSRGGGSEHKKILNSTLSADT